MSTQTSPETNLIDSSNPLYLHPSDHPGLILVSKPFDGNGFGAWKRSMSIALSAKNKLSFVKGEITKPNSAPQLDLWQRCNDMVISWILNTLSHEIRGSVIYSATAQQLWNDLSERFGQSNGARLYQLQKSLGEISQGVLNLLPSCTCGVSQDFAKREKDQRLFQFLMGLNSNYDKVRGTILMMKPLPSIGQAYALLVQDKKQREIHSSTQFVSESAAMNVSDTNRFQNNKSVVCPNCNKVGHLANKCYRIIGFPKDTKFTKNKKFAANVCAESHGSGDDVSKSTSPNQILTPAQYKEFISLLQKFANINDNAPTTNAINYANFVGPFTEEASGSR
uniref:Putative zinc finger, CCHC-type, Gag-polypeptide of LTR copia-type n=2 Tax=Helianthus annuus TaxID=4232 RepID=A0A251S0A7_HELAN